MKGLVKIDDENSGYKLLTHRERSELAAAMCAAGKHGRAFDKEKRNQAVVDILLHRDRTNKKGGRKFVMLSPSARQVLKTGKAVRDFRRCFFVQFRDVICITKEKVTSLMRLKQCSYEVAARHVRDLTALLIAKKIYDPLEDGFFPGKEGNVIWQDEMGQFFQYVLRRGSSANVVGAKGVPARSGETENRQQFSYDGAIGGDMFLYDIHLIFRAERFTADMVPPDIKHQKHAMVSTTDKGCQVGCTFLARQKSLLRQARQRGIRGDTVFVTDGHASRFYVELLPWLDESTTANKYCVSGNDMYITPPNATGT